MKPTGRTFIVSGGSAGLGLATVETLLDSDAHVAIFDLRPPQKPLVHQFRTKFWEVDITNAEVVAKAVAGAAAWAAETGAPLGGVVNCAGVGTAAKVLGSDGEPHSLDLWKFALDVNLTGTFNLTRLACKYLQFVPADGPDGERGVIIMVASSAAFEGQPGQTAYAASKGALVSMTLPMSRDLARHGIRVMTIAPGAFASAMTDKMTEKTRASLHRELIFPKRMGTAAEFAQTVKWIVECPYVNGETIRLSGASRLPGKM
ncbi:short chain type dehydrogenase [Artomyces pyxidatus]|uniref:Short chain type dehydrogenase n=1 Tax=Artomyces pyxidatus TaxID=48021 RepID=A0ACB8SWS3_9AGAM|nr:short chain type dehydrogenase [Artomyces pyxidatus]